MKNFPEHIIFKHPWRSYQKQVLDELDTHLNDNQLYIIAPPGSGKTVLGLEVMLRINQPTLILAPSITIRNQWILRFKELFLDTTITPDWISDDIYEPNFLTVSTYQSIHSLISSGKEREEEPEKYLSKYLKKGITTVVVDEAHHIKNSWWKSLNTLKETLNPKTVSLTATPPYDTSFAEWNRFLNFNGDIDAEIFIPSLVKEKNLCPHQDYVFFCTPSAQETKELTIHHETTRKLYEELKSDTSLIKLVKNISYFTDPKNHLEWIYSNIQNYSAILIFLNSNNISISKEHLEIIGNEELKIPELDRTWLEIIINYLLYEYESLEHKVFIKSLHRKLHENRLIDHKKVNFSNNFNSNNLLRNSISKLKAIEEITISEHNSLGTDLRQVILTDYIRKEYFTPKNSNELLLKKIGVGSIFERLRRAQIKDLNIAVLTGSIVIIPNSLTERLNQLSSVKEVSISYKTLPYDINYVIIQENSSSIIVELITQLFEEGYIQVLIGTKSLLGEGWDAPSINTLLLASFIGSFVSSNQMRGRAIRRDLKKPLKTANIWHLISIDKYDPTGGYDFELLKRRFKTFVGLSNTAEPYIANGYKRLHLPDNLLQNSDLDSQNKITLTSSQKRSDLFERWEIAINKGSIITKEVLIPFPENESYPQLKKLYFNKTLKNALITVGSILLTFIQNLLNFIVNNTQLIRNFIYLIYALMAGGLFGLIFYGRLLIKTAIVYIKYRDISKDIEKISLALLNTLCKSQLISTSRHLLKVVSHQDHEGNITAYITGASSYENNIFTNALTEIVNPIDNPRYIINRTNKMWNIFLQKDYHNVPDIIGRSKKTAMIFLRQWREHVSNSDLIYTRTVQGRKHLLHARFNSLSSEFVTEAERFNSWH